MLRRLFRRGGGIASGSCRQREAPERGVAAGLPKGSLRLGIAGFPRVSCRLLAPNPSPLEPSRRIVCDRAFRTAHPAPDAGVMIRMTEAGYPPMSARHETPDHLSKKHGLRVFPGGPGFRQFALTGNEIRMKRGSPCGHERHRSPGRPPGRWPRLRTIPRKTLCGARP